MKVILIKDVGGLGKRDTVKDVSDGYALNHLIANGLAVQATPQRITELEKRTKAAGDHAAIQEAHQQSLINKLSGASISLKDKVNEHGHLYHQVTTFQIANEINHVLHTNIGPEAIVINEPIKAKGEHTVEVHLGGKVAIVKVKVNG